jgi:hypothetical protein
VTLREQICKAIAERRLVSFDYKDGRLTAEPQILGQNEKGTDILSAWFLEGAGLSAGEGWRDYAVSKINNLQVLGRKFAGARPGYVSGGGRKFKNTVCELKPELDVENALAGVRKERDPLLKSQMLASLCSALFRDAGFELVVVGGSAIEFYTDGAYMSGDVDLCSINRPLPLALRQTVMQGIGATEGPRNWKLAGMFVDLLGPVEAYARTEFRKVAAPFGMITLMKVEDLLVERVLMAMYPEPDEGALNTARVLAANMLAGQTVVDWREVTRVANLPEYRILPELKALVRELSNELKIKSPIDSE